jgi:hypothetical protein
LTTVWTCMVCLLSTSCIQALGNNKVLQVNGSCFCFQALFE